MNPPNRNNLTDSYSLAPSLRGLRSGAFLSGNCTISLAVYLLAAVTTAHLVPEDIRHLYEVHEWRNATGVLIHACPQEWEDILCVLRGFKLMHSEIAVGGGNKSKVSDRIDSQFYNLGWEEKQFRTRILVDDRSYDSPTHKVDCFKGRVGVEVEWNNKDPFYDRDLNNFRLLFDLRVIDAGIIITRCDELQAIFNRIGRGKSYQNSTTHMSKLLPRLEGGSGGGCPILVFGIRKELYVENE